MNPSKIAINNPMSVFILVAMILLLGFLSYRGLPREAAPDIQIPLLIVTIPYLGASPEDVESLITRKAELEFQNIEHLKEIKSTSAEGAVSITLEFTADFDVDQARVKVREALDNIRPELPNDIEDPIITEINLSEQPLLLVNLSGQVGLVNLKDVAENLKELIETIPGILEVRRAGGLEREVRVYVDPEKLRYYHVDLNQISNTIQRENTNLPGGTLEIGPTKYLIRVPGEFQHPDEIRDLVVAAPGQVPIFVRDVATVVFGFKELTSRSRLDGLESVSLSVVKRSGENLLGIRDKVRTLVNGYQKRHEGRIRFTILADQGKRVQQIVTDLENNVFTGFLLVAAVLLVVMGVRNALFVAAAIPLSFLLTSVLLQWMGFTLNIVVLFALILALGMLVDNAIVVVENIYRHMEAGKTRREAALVGIGEVAIPVTTSTLTTLLAFAPIIAMPGVVGEFMGYLPKTLIVALSASLVVGLIINPVFCSTMMRAKGKPTGNLNEWEQVGKSRILATYRRVLEKTLQWRGTTLLVALLLFFLITGAYLGTTLRARGIEFFPSTEPDEAVVNITAPIGATLEVSDHLVQEVEKNLGPLRGGIQAVIANVGQRRGFGASQSGSTTTNLSHVVIDFPGWEDRKEKPTAVLGKTRKDLSLMTGAEVRVAKQQHGPPTGAPINIEIRGDDFAVMKEISERMKATVKGLPGLVDLRDDFDRNRPEIRVLIDREKTARLGLRTADVARTVRTAFQGQEVSVYREGKEEYDIVVQLDRKFRVDPGDLETLFMLTPAGESVPLSELARVVTGPAYGTIRHVKLDRVVTLSADAEGIPGPVLLKMVRAKLKDFSMPQGYFLSFTGENEMLNESRAFLLQAFFMALFLIFLVLVTQFNSLLVPFIIMTSVVLSLMGVFLGLMIHDQPFGVMMTGVGVISLAGIVVNNAIVLIDFIRQLRKRGFSRDEAVVLAGMVRLRPVLLTAITTVLGLLPMAMGIDINFYRWPPLLLGSEGGAMWRPMALAVMYGLSIATLMTLVVVPVLYSGLEEIKERLGRLVFGAAAGAAPQPGPQPAGD